MQRVISLVSELKLVPFPVCMGKLYNNGLLGIDVHNPPAPLHKRKQEEWVLLFWLILHFCYAFVGLCGSSESFCVSL